MGEPDPTFKSLRVFKILSARSKMYSHFHFHSHSHSHWPSQVPWVATSPEKAGGKRFGKVAWGWDYSLG